MKGRKYPKLEVVKYLYAVREVKYREGGQYVMIQLSEAQDVTWNDWYTTLQGHWMKKGEKRFKLYNLGCVYPLWFGWLGRSTWQMALTNDLYRVIIYIAGSP